MPPESPDARPVVRSSALIGQVVTDRRGDQLGRIADLETARDADGRERVVAAMVTGSRWGRLLGYERAEVTGPWLLEWLARRVIRRHTRRVAWTDVRLPDHG